MTTASRIQQHRKTNPDCPVRSHAPGLPNWKRGCICPETVQAVRDWALAEADRRAPCTAETHRPTNTAWQHGCRHSGALLAHEEFKARIRKQRSDALRGYRETGQCSARVHDTVGAYRRGCRCDLAVKLYGASSDGRNIARLRQCVSEKLENPWRQGGNAVGRVNLWMLVHGFVDSPTKGERMAAVAILSRRGTDLVGYGRKTGLLDNQQIAERIGINDTAVTEIRKRMAALRETRPQRRLADVRAKAMRVARATERTARHDVS